MQTVYVEGANSDSDAREVLLAVLRGLLEIPTPSLRAVAVRWSEESVGLRFLYDGEPSEAERELAALGCTYTIADLPPNWTLSHEEVLSCPWTADLVLDPGWEAWAYRRYEPGARGELPTTAS